MSSEVESMQEGMGEEEEMVRYLLLLHHACLNYAISLEVIQRLVEQWPESVGQFDKYNMLPLHYACRNVAMTLEVVKYLVDQWPESVRAVDWDYDEMTPLHRVLSWSDVAPPQGIYYEYIKVARSHPILDREVARVRGGC